MLGKGRIKLQERQKFPSKVWLLRAVKGQSRSWILDTFGHMSFGLFMGTIVAALSMYFFKITIAQFAGISGISILMDLTINGRLETVWINTLHSKYGRSRVLG